MRYLRSMAAAVVAAAAAAIWSFSDGKAQDRPWGESYIPNSTVMTQRGKPEEFRAINYKFGDRSGVISEHRNEIVVGNDATGEWQKDSVFGDIDRLALAVRSLDPKWHDQVRPPQNMAGLTGTAMSSQPG